VNEYTEKSVEIVKKKMKATGLTHPIAIDNKTTMCKSYWPSVYLFDKQGIARWDWAGEPNWKGPRGRPICEKRSKNFSGNKA
jgi:hypothetical protein